MEYVKLTKENIDREHICCAISNNNDVQGYVLYYTGQCPFNAKYVPVVENTARDHGVQFKAIHITTREQASNAPAPITTCALFYNGVYVTNEQMNDKRFLKLISEINKKTGLSDLGTL